MKEIIQTKKDKIYDLIALLPDSSEKNKMHIINTITQVPLQIDKYHPCSGIYNPISYKEGKVCIRRTDYKSNPCIYCDSQDKEFTVDKIKKKRKLKKVKTKKTKILKKGKTNGRKRK